MRRVLGLLLAIALALPGAVSAQTCNVRHPCPTGTPAPRVMGITALSGFETGSLLAEFYADNFPPSVVGNATIESTIVRTGAKSLKLAPASGAQGLWVWATATQASTFIRFYLRVTTLPATARGIVGTGSTNGMTLNPDGSLSLFVTTGAGIPIGTTTTKLTDTTRWYQIGMTWNGSTGEKAIAIDGVTEFSLIQAGSSLAVQYGASDTVAATYTAYIDDIARDSSALPAPGAVVMLLPTADSAVGTGWTLGTGTAISGNSGSTAVKNTPPVGVADLAAGSDPKQIRNAAAAANSNYDATMTTYSAAGIAAVDTVNAVIPLVITAAPVVTSAKAGTVGVASNPTIANIALGAAGTAGAFWQGNAAGTYATGWKTSAGTVTLAPSVTVGTTPVMRITQVTSSTRIAMVCFMGMYVDYTPGPLPYVNVYPPMIGQ